MHGDVFAGSELGELEVDDLGDRLEGRPFDPETAPLEAYTLARDLYTEAYFPTVVRAGAAFQVGGTSLGATYSATQGGGELHLGWPQYLAIGAEQKLPVLSFLAVRAGMATSLSGANAISGGASLRIGPVHIAAAVSRTTGTAEPGEATLPSARFGERMVAGSGYSGTLGIELLRF